MIQLTQYDGKKVWFSVNQITAVCEDRETQYAAVYTIDCQRDYRWLVKETPTSVVGLIEQERRNDVSEVFS